MSGETTGGLDLARGGRCLALYPAGIVVVASI